jgi:2-methylcitrate dehydratase PrpD
VRGNVGLGDFDDAAVKDPAVLAVAAKVRYVVDPDNRYPKNFTGHVRAVMKDGSVIEERQPYMRGGAHEPLTRADIDDKFILNARYGGWQESRIGPALAEANTLYVGPLDLKALRG